ncbi:RraA family protein [Sagittula salina]|uniref:Putative 4-hydroxy-4-methyl-2-oxoglutarate aldolase n=1 Tax=Sagittula salina TaxID=2820268 RepID=A0A940MNB3_9RHOB|nr:RraA family protein [Sagittula salina]MBP0481673.1 RraA family protein [Sagittula salina]
MIEVPPALTLIASAPRPTDAQIAAFQGVETAHVADAMGGTAAMDASVAPLGFGQDLPSFAAGPALVCDSGPADILATLAAVERLVPGDILVHAAHGTRTCATIGDQISGMLKNAGAAAFVTDGPMRDYEGIVKTGLPCWCAGLNPNSPSVSGPGVTGTAAVVGGRHVSTGDMIVADLNGVVVVPFDRIDEIIGKIAEVKRLEEDLAEKVRAGFREPLDTRGMLAEGRAVEIS